jgi:peptide/nickel transport system substrate-binding protein
LVNFPFGGIDPATYSSLASWLTTSMTNDGLTAFKHVGGSDGAQVVPDLAVSLPTPTDGGLTYTFQLRRGIRYSNGAPVRPEDFLRAAERDLRFNGPVEGFASVIGAAACTVSRCDLSRGIIADDSAHTVTFKLAAPDPEFLQQLAGTNAVAVPAGTPENIRGPLPATGPYEVASYSPSHLVRLVRNPYFHQWSRAAQPDGYPDQIVWRIGAGTSTALTMVEHNRADFTLDGPPPDRLSEVRTRFAGRLHTNPNDVTVQLVLNTTVPPFNDVSVRRALSYAIDRHELTRLLGQSSQPTCQLLPPGYIDGYQRYCPYTLNPNRAGAWSAPDLATARRLIAASHTRGMRIVVWSQPGYLTPNWTTTGRYLVSLLDKLGYHARIKAFAANDSGFSRVYDPAQKVQAALWVRTPAYPAASQFFVDFQCPNHHPQAAPINLNPSGFCDPQLDATIRKAFAAEGTDLPTATRLWARADRQITDQAPFVSFVTPSVNDVVSRRVGDYTYNAEFGVLIDQLWVR